MSNNQQFQDSANGGAAKAAAHVYMTALFNHDIRSLGSNLHRTDTPFGCAEVLEDGNLFERFDELEAVKDDLLEALKPFACLDGNFLGNITDEDVQRARSAINRAESGQ